MPKKISAPVAGKPRKIKVQIGALVYSQILMDVEDYALRSPSALYTHLCALGIGNLPGSFSTVPEEDSMPQESVSFTLPPAVAAPFVEACMERSIGAAAAVRSLLYTYAGLARCKREEMVRCVEVRWLMGAITNGQKVELSYRGVPCTMEPCFLAHSQGMGRSYLVAYDPARKDFRCLRLAYIHSVDVLRSAASYRKDPRLAGRAKDLKRHFDPFLSYGQKIKIRLTAVGAEQMRRAATNRPACDMEGLKAGVHEFQCSPLQAQIYFAAFLDEAEILDPESLREWFAQKMRRAAALYNT